MTATHASNLGDSSLSPQTVQHVSAICSAITKHHSSPNDDEEACIGPIPVEPLWPVLSPSAKSRRTRNPIRAIVDPIVASLNNQRGDGKLPISLALGDPTVYDNLPSCPIAVEAIQATLRTSTSAAGYVNACGTLEARDAVARFHQTDSAEHVILANGCSGALELAFTALLDPDSVLLVPQPGFPLYQVIAESHGASVVHYRLNPDDWTIDLDHLRYLLGSTNKVTAMVINNPSNPTGAVYSSAHLQDILSVCHEYRLPIVADEIYGDLVYGKHQFFPIANLARDWQVPVITASGIGKQFLVPGWRVGWIVFHDNDFGTLQEVLAGAKRLAQVVLGASHLAQTAVPALLSDQTIEWKSGLRLQLEEQSVVLCSALKECTGLRVIDSFGAMYAMVKIDISMFIEIENDVDFADKLLKEENVFVLPGSCFGLKNAFRVVFCASPVILEEAARRIRSFCDRHRAHLDE